MNKIMSKLSFGNKLVLAMFILTLIGAEGAFARPHNKFGWSHFEKADLNLDGQLTPDEIAQWHETWFQGLDNDSDGTVLKEDFQKFMLEKWKSEKNDEKSGGVVDKNNDGQVNREEFLEFFRQKAEQRAERRFGFLDRDKDGVLSASELVKAGDGHGRSFRHGHKRFRPARLFSRFDQDNDGKLSSEESLKAWQKWFSRRDKNQDGALTREEIQR